ncbi:MAG TPA: hypothetical protein VHS31_14980 [Tepidisphaeraceae bacterium]|nr:hypothetical protein [Tepidisphaeraceae bacterium]
MSRRMFVATALAIVVGSFGPNVFAAESKTDGAVSPHLNGVPECVLHYLGPSESIRNSLLENILPQITDLSPSVISHEWAPFKPRLILANKSEPPTELPLLPLPSPFWTGAAGLLVLGGVRLFKSLLRNAN